MDAQNLMDNSSLSLVECVSPGIYCWEEEVAAPQLDRDLAAMAQPSLDAETLRRLAWEIGERKAADAFVPVENHVGLAAVTPTQGFAHWRIRQDWVDEAARRRGAAWHHCRLVLRLYDVSYIHFTGFNAHRLQDETLPNLCGQRFFHLPRAGTTQLAEVGFVLRSGEFIPAARSSGVQFGRDRWSSQRSHDALFVDDRGRIEPAGNVWEQEQFLREKRRPKLRRSLRIAYFTFGEQGGQLPAFVHELTRCHQTLGHEVHVFTASESDQPLGNIEGVHYHPVPLHANDSPLASAQAFARGVESRLVEAPPFDLLHHHEWRTGLAALRLRVPHILSLTSLESTRRNGHAPSPLSLAVEEAERTIARKISCLLAPEWLRQKTVADLGVDEANVHSFPMEGRLANEWERPLDYGQVKGEIGVGPLDRLILFIGPLEHAAGVDLLVEALPTVLRRYGNLRLAFIGAGPMYGFLEQRAHQLGIAFAVRLLGHREGPQVNRLVRAAESLILPSRCRLPFDDAVVDLARKAGRAVVTTHGGPAYLVRHEENGLITYDNPGSMVWAFDRLLGDAAHTERMGRNGQRCEGSIRNWNDVARLYLELCAERFPELTLTEQ
jgi:glycosyltransferase involved in cell wall biosynthesis